MEIHRYNSKGMNSGINTSVNESCQMIKIGHCYIARFAKKDMFIRIEAVDPKGGWKARSLKHGRILIVKSESQILQECSDSDLQEYAKMVIPNRRSKRQPPTPVSVTPLAAHVRKAKRPQVPEFGLTLIEAAYRVLREAKKPLNCHEIVDRAFKKKYHRSHGATPANTLNAALANDIQSKGNQTRFAKVGRGLFSAR